MRLSLAALKEQSQAIVVEEVLETIQGGSNEDCHVWIDAQGNRCWIKGGVIIWSPPMQH